MQILSSWKGIRNRYGRSVVGLGNFDGVHVGHRKLITEMVKRARKTGAVSVVFTFYPHPLAVLNPALAPPLLLSQEDKEQMIADLGVDIMLLVPFTLEFALLSPNEFIRRVICREMGVNAVFVGYNYTFGHKGLGTPKMLEQYGKQWGYDVFIIPPVSVNGQIVSSTLIRNLLKEGEVVAACKFLGYRPFTKGIVVTGERRGRLLGFPTANIEVTGEVLLPANGVYVVEVFVEGSIIPGVANIGTKPTFHHMQRTRTVEVHLLDFSGDIYGKILHVAFLHRLREERRFDSPEELIIQIKHDVASARDVAAAMKLV